MAEFNPELPVNLGGSEDYDPGVTKNISVGMTENGRGIMTKKFDQDHILTKIEFDVRGGKFLSAALPAVIRVYQFGFKSDARFLTLTGTGNFSTKISLEITNRETTRQVIVDAWAPNNWAGFGGSAPELDPSTAGVGSHVNAQPFIGHLQIFGKAKASTSA